MANYALVNASGLIVNRIILNDPSSWEIPGGLSLMEETDIHLMIGGTYLDGDYTPPLQPEPPGPPVPTITKAQALLYLLLIGKTEADVDAAIATISDPTRRAIAEIEWKYRLTFHHDHPLFIELGPILGISDMEASFRVASTL